MTKYLILLFYLLGIGASFFEGECSWYSWYSGYFCGIAVGLLHYALFSGRAAERKGENAK